MTREWVPCEFELDGIRFRVVEGRKRPVVGDHIDHKIEWLTPKGWVPLRFFTVGVISDFLMWNEDGLYPPWFRHLLGGRKLLQYLNHAYKHDVDRAEAGLQIERASKTTLFEEAS